MTERVGFRARLRARLRRWLGIAAEEPVAPTPPPHGKERYEPPDNEDPLVVAAGGGLFDFHLIVRLRWSSEGISAEVLRERSRFYEENARNTVLHKLWATARDVDPHALAEAEEKLNQQIKAGWCYEDTIWCCPSVRVRLDPRLREEMLPYQTRRIKLREENDLAMLKADLVSKLAERWLQVISELEHAPAMGPDERQFLLPFAARLTDEQFANVTTSLARTRRELIGGLTTVLHEASTGHNDLGLFEFAAAYDKALQALSRQVGINPRMWLLPETAGANGAGGDDAASASQR